MDDKTNLIKKITNHFEDLKQQSGKFPDKSGVYLFKDHSNQILYVGKAKNLKKRIKSYFYKINDIKNRALVKDSATIENITTKNELEAMFLEAKLIKANQPKFNILLKEGQPFLYIVITNSSKNLPVIKITRNKKLKGTYFGPFLEKNPTRKVYNFLIKTFKLKICNKKIENGCLDYHMNICAGSCKTDFDQEKYLERLELAKLSLKKGHTNFLKYLEKQIQLNNKKLNFEKSKELYEYLKAFKIVFKNLDEKYTLNTTIKTLLTKDIWILDLKNKSLFLFKEKNSALKQKIIFSLHFKEKNYINYIKSYYRSFDCSNIILLNFKIDKSEKILLEKFLKKFHHKEQPVNIINPNKHHYYNLIKLAQIQVKQYFKKQKNLEKGLRTLLKLKKEPHTLDCFDISHNQGKFITGSCIRFKDGQPDKKNFRHFKITTINYSNDYACLQEIVKRRYKNKNNIPDLILIDGGKGQLSAITKIIPNAEVASLAKKEETIFSKRLPYGKKLNIKNYSSQILIVLRNHAHHFAINYHRKISKIS